MGEFTDNFGINQAANDVNVANSGTEEGKPEEGFKTDVTDVFADAEVKQGKDTYPVFDVTDNEFNQNGQYGRKRMRFTGNAQKYMQGTKYNRPFFIRNTAANGKQYTRRIK